MRYGDNPHFTDEEIEAQNGYGMCSALHSWLTCIVRSEIHSEPSPFSPIALINQRNCPGPCDDEERSNGPTGL